MLGFHSFLGFQHGSDSSVKAIMVVILVIVSSILKIFAYQASFREDLHKSVLYILNLISKKKLAHYARHDMNIFWLVSFVKVPWRYWTEFSQSWKVIRKTLRSHENLRSLNDLSGANTGFHSNSRDWLFWMFLMSKVNPLMNKS